LEEWFYELAKFPRTKQSEALLKWLNLEGYFSLEGISEIKDFPENTPNGYKSHFLSLIKKHPNNSGTIH
jgi:hypothetical protein